MSFDLSTDTAIVVTKEWFDNTYNRDDYDQVVVKVKSGLDTAAVKTIIEKQTEQAGQDRQCNGQQGNAGVHLSRRLARSRHSSLRSAGSRWLLPGSRSSTS